jgi:nucleoside-diphosphate-sugar epimerase
MPESLSIAPLDERGEGARERVLVTGCAGFIGSHLSERLVDEGHEVVGVDCFTDYYERRIKWRNLSALLEEPAFTLHELDLSRDPLEGVVDGVQVVYHLAAQAGVRGSFGESFGIYARNNIRATQRLLDAVGDRSLRCFVYASSSSVYGHMSEPTSEAVEPRPVSPYGMTKVATETLAGVYGRTCGVRTVGLRYFTAYGPRQRPDMAFSRFIERALDDRPLTVLGDGSQVRDFTFIADIVDGTIAAGERGVPGSVYNIGGGAPVRLSEVFTLLGELLERPLKLEYRDGIPGEARGTLSDCRRAVRELAYAPRVSLAQGLAAQLDWTQRLAPSDSESVRSGPPRITFAPKRAKQLLSGAGPA